MFFWLSQYLDFNLLSYISVRATIAFFIAFSTTLYFMPKFIKWAKKKSATQPIYELAPDGHKEKKNIPTMGGVVFILSAFFAILISGNLSNNFVLIGIVVLILFMGIGILDDYGKIFAAKNSAGLTSRVKFGLQVMVATVIAIFLIYNGFTTELYFPFYKHPVVDLGLFAIIFWAIIITGSSNAVNLTDGLDGLAAVPSVFAFLSLAVLTYITGHAILSASLLMPKIMGVGEVVIIATAMIGGLIGFLWYNSHPAEVFMGDSGSLTIGATIGYLGVLAKSEFLLLLIGFIFVIETLSVILQVWSFKYRKKRVFLMAPLHHHYELKKWAESKIIIRFWIVALIANLFAIITIKIR